MFVFAITSICLALGIYLYFCVSQRYEIWLKETGKGKALQSMKEALMLTREANRKVRACGKNGVSGSDVEVLEVATRALDGAVRESNAHNIEVRPRRISQVKSQGEDIGS
jgi:hypothetical protein